MFPARPRQAHHLAEERHEAEKHRTVYLDLPPERLLMSEQDWEKVRNPPPLSAYYASMARLGDIRGLRILDAGCGDGWCSVILGKLGATVTGLDVCPEAIRTAQRRAIVNGVSESTSFHVGSLYELSFPTDAFDLVMGHAVLHHLRDKDLAAREIRRVLAPGGRGLFVECFGASRTLERLRRLVPVAPQGDPDDWQNKIDLNDLAALEAVFDTTVRHFGLLQRLDRVLPQERVVTALGRVDRLLLSRLPPLRQLSRTVMIELR